MVIAHTKGRGRGAGAAVLLLLAAAPLYIAYQDMLLRLDLGLRGWGSLHRSANDTPSQYQSVPSPRHRDPSPGVSRGDGASPRDRQWSFITSKMCPNFEPNSNAWNTLFELARKELGLSVEAHPMDLIAQDSFFRFNYGGLGYLHDGNRFMLYLRIFKCGNDAIRVNLQEALGKGDRSNRSRLQDFKTISASYSDGMRRVDPSKVCVVTAIRDPISHFLSAVNEIEWREAERRRLGKGAELHQNWDDRPPPFLSHGNGTVARFEQFVRDLIGGARSSGLFGGYKEHGVQQITHAFSMTGVLWGLKRLRECRGEENASRLTAYLPSLVNLDTAFPKMLHDACPGLPPLDAFHQNVVHGSQSDEYGYYEAAKRSWNQQGKVARALCALHTLDYACFDLPIPSLCQELYSQPRFRHALLRAIGKGKKPAEPNPCSSGNFL